VKAGDFDEAPAIFSTPPDSIMKKRPKKDREPLQPAGGEACGAGTENSCFDAGVDPGEIAIISPYSAQVKLLNGMILAIRGIRGVGGS